MQTGPGFRVSAVFAVLLLLAGTAYADNFSFTGNFTQDDQMQIFNFTLASSATVTLETLGYAGGTNAAGQAIAAGGFDPFLSLFDSSGTLIGVNNDGTGVATDATGAALDSLLTETLVAGSYTLVLTQSDNGPNGPTFADGFLETGNGNFTAMFACSNGIFCDLNGANRDGNWAVDIDNVTSAAGSGTTNVPEPSASGLMGALLLLGLNRLRGAEKAVRQ